MTLTLPKPTSPYVWNSRIRGKQGRLPHTDKGAPPARIPRVRQCRHRTDKSGGKAQRLQIERKGNRTRTLRGGQGYFRYDRHRPYALGHARRAQRRERPSPLFGERLDSAHSQRHHRKLRGTESHARGERLHLPQRNRHRGTRTVHRIPAHGEPVHAVRSGTGGTEPGHRSLCHRSARPHQQR